MNARILIAFMALLACSSLYAELNDKPPGRQENGFGSTETYIASSYETVRMGSASQGDKLWYYVPDQLKNGDSAPTIIFLHGFSALFPYVYRSHIEHLLFQGNIVIFPQFQKSSLWGFLNESGILSPADQNIWAQRAVDSANGALNDLGSRVASNEIYLYGHSLGGLIALAWQAHGGQPVQGIMLSHPQVDSSAGMPAFVAAFVKIEEIPWRDYVGDIDVPVVILNGDEDTIAPISQSEEILAGLTSSPHAQLYVAQGDDYGRPRISPNHGAPLDAIFGLPPHLKIFGISGEMNMLDWRYYFAGLDGFMWEPTGELEFDLGQWSDGTEVLPVLRID